MITKTLEKSLCAVGISRIEITLPMIHSGDGFCVYLYAEHENGDEENVGASEFETNSLEKEIVNALQDAKGVKNA